jgi:hypothetical protein
MISGQEMRIAMKDAIPEAQPAVILKLLQEVAQMKLEHAEQRLRNEALAVILKVTRMILCGLDPEFRRLSDAHIRGLREHFAAIGLDEGDPLVKATLAEAESFLADDKQPSREMMSVIKGGRDAADGAMK